MAYIFAFLMLIFSQGVVFADDNIEFAGTNKPSDVAPLVLTEEEQQWLAAHKQIEVAYDGSLPPYSFVNDSGQIDGVAVEIMALLSQRLGLRFITYPNFNWANLYKAAVNKRVDVVATMVNRPDRQDSFGFTKPYLTKSLVIVTKQDNATINNRPDLENKKVAVVSGYQYAYQIKKEFPTVTSVEVPNMLTSLQKVEDGSVDAAIVFLGTANFLQTKHGLNSLRIAAYYDRNNANESIAIRKDWPILTTILQKGLDSLTEQEVQKIFAKWVVGNMLMPENMSIPVASPPATLTPPPISTTEKIVDPAPVNIGQENQVGETSSVDSLLLNNIAVFFAVTACLILLRLFLARKQRKKRRVKVKNVMMTSVRNLQSERNEAMHLTIEPSPVADEAIKVTTIQHQHDLANSEQIAYHRDCEGRMTYVSSNVTNLLGYSETDFMLNFHKYLTDNPVNLQLDEQMESTIQGRPSETYDIELYDAGQGVHWLRVTDTPIYNGQGHCIGIDGVMDDVTAQTLYDKVAIKSSAHDEPAMPEPVQVLHHLIKEAVHTATQNRQAFVLIYVMLDRLRSLDGESVASDESAVLDESTRRLKATLRDTDVVMQFESNKYALVLPDTNGDMIGLVIEKIRKILQVPYLIGVHSIVLDANIGIAVYPKDGVESSDLIAEAQILLPSGEPQQVGGYATAENNKEGDNLRLQQDLLAALDECKLSLRASNQQNVNALHRHSQLSVYYQSRHNLEDYNITGFEALIRWRHPQIGIVLPYEFVPLINDIGLIDVMSYWIIQQVSFQAVAWEEQGVRPELITINLSDLAIKQTIDIQKIISIIVEAGAKTEWLAISISESEVINNANLILPVIKELASHGLVISIDNFGNDSNFLTLLADIPAQFIEIDPYFVRDVSDNYTNPEIITHTVTMLHEQGKKVILKEVETEAQLDFLKTTGCDMMQGYLLSRAVPSTEAKELMETFPDVAWYFQQK
jgi:PAS domain S-box-containing protein